MGANRGGRQCQQHPKKEVSASGSLHEGATSSSWCSSLWAHREVPRATGTLWAYFGRSNSRAEGSKYIILSSEAHAAGNLMV